MIMRIVGKYIYSSIILSVLIMFLFAQSAIEVIANEDVCDIAQVTDIEVSEYEKTMEVGTSQMITATLIPADVEDMTISYSSSNSEIAEVNSDGEVKAIAKGKAIIYVTAGNVTKELPIEVKVRTTDIKVDSVCVVLKVGASYKLTAKAIPTEANQSISYKVVDNTVANVSSTGNITGLNVGTTTVLISNGDYQTAATVIVNVDSDNKVSNDECNEKNDSDDKHYYEISADVKQLITSEQLSNLYSEKQVLTIKGNGYKMVVKGRDIINCDNELLTDIDLKKDTDFTTFVINDCKPLCGDIIVSLDELHGKYVYLYNQDKEKYEFLRMDGARELVLSSPGKYMITDKKITVVTDWLVFVLVTLAVVMVGGSVAYIVVKKRYWFW